MKYDQKEQEAVFRYGLISEFIHGDLERGTKRKRLQKIAAGTYRVPWKTMPYEVSVSKLRRWIAAYRRHGIDGLKRKDRKDKGTTKALKGVRH
jgi:transposase